MPQEFSVGLHRVQITDLHICETYGGVFEFSDFRRANDYLIREVREQMKPLWGNKSVMLLDPFSKGAQLLQASSISARTMPLPKWLVYSWLVSDWRRDPHSCGTQLLVGFFAPDVFHEPIGRVVENTLAELSWEAFAEDYWSEF